MSPTPAANRLAGETSPYLLQHAHNPVDWYPWGDEALALARRLDRPLFLSIGYSACHWCHVMERECFEDPGIAAVMNDLYVNVKVDREERPDLDEIYMTSCQLLTGQGGWPLSVWLTPELEPFYAGTYFPPASRWGRPGFPELLRRLHQLYSTDRPTLARQAAALTEAIRDGAGLPAGDESPGPELVDGFVDAWRRRFDPQHGGTQGAPKFPPSFALEVLLRRRETHPDERSRLETMLTTTLDGMARGGMFDQLGGGFHRYSTDERWLVPHFEKMLYDNALLAPVYLRAGAALERPDYLRVARETLGWCLREMVAPEGGIYSTQDADSEGVEGKYFVFSLAEVEEALPEVADRALARAWFDLSTAGNWHEMPGRTVLATPRTRDAVAAALGLDEDAFDARLERVRSRLLEVRRRRTPPATDTKILTAWNGLMLGALAMGGARLEDPAMLEAARGAAAFCLGTLRDARGLLRTAREGHAHLNAYHEDYAYLGLGLLDLFEATMELRWLEAARQLAEEMRARFWDPVGRGFFFTSEDHEALLARIKNPTDNATPSGNSVAVKLLLRLGHLSGEAAYRTLALETLEAFAPSLARHPLAYGNMVAALDLSRRPPVELVLVGDPGDATLRAMRALGLARLPMDAPVLVLDPARPDLPALEGAVPLLAGKAATGAPATAHLCAGGACQRPVHTSEALAEALGEGPGVR